MNNPAAETTGYQRIRYLFLLSFPLVGNPSERFWTSQNDTNTVTLPQATENNNITDVVENTFPRSTLSIERAWHTEDIFCSRVRGYIAKYCLF